MDSAKRIAEELCNANKERQNEENKIIKEAYEKIEKLASAMDESFGTNASLNPKNIVDISKFKVSTPEVTVSVSPEHRDLVSTQVINNVKYVMIRVTGCVEVNGINVKTDD